MTTKVVKGSIWTLAGSVLPFAVSFISTPFVIRFLGTESYGVLLLIGLIPMYFSFADFGMGVASTKFGSEAYGEDDPQKEREIVWTATTIALTASLLVAIPIFAFSFQLVTAFNVPQHLLTEASLALRLAAAAFVFGILGTVLNSPMLARLRMDLNTITSALPKIFLAAGTPLILFLGGGIVEAVFWGLIVGFVTLLAIVLFSRRLLPELLPPAIDGALVRPLMRFGGGLVVGGIAAVLLVNFEKLALSTLISVTSLAYYSVAYTLASIAMLFSFSMTQSLVPAFSQLLSPDKRDHLNALFSTTLRLTIVMLLPLTVVLFVLARPFFTLWAGEDFGRESTVPFYVLLIGVAFNMLAFIQHSLITSTGRTALIATIYWIEFVLYAIISIVLIYFLDIVGAALAWTLRVAADSIVFIILGERIVGVTFRFYDQLRGLILPFLVLAPIPVVVLWYDRPLLSFALTPICLAVYSILIWGNYLGDNERDWLKGRLSRSALRR